MANKGPKAQSSITSFTETAKRKNEDDLDNRELRRRIEDNTIANGKVDNEPEIPKSPKPQIKHNNVPMFKTLRKLGNKLEQVNHHYDLLMTYKTNHQAPRGLKVRINPTAADLPIDLYTKWEECHTQFATELTEILITHWKRKKDSITEDITAALAFLQVNTDQDELDHITNLVEKCRITKREELTSRREKKSRKEETDTSEERPATEQAETS